MVVRKHEPLKENFLVDRKDRLVLEVNKKDSLLVSEVRKKDVLSEPEVLKNELPLVSEDKRREHYVQLQVERKELLRHSY